MRPRPSPRSLLPRVAWAALLGLTLARDAAAAPAPVPAGQPPNNINTAASDYGLESDGGGRLRHRGDGFTAIIHPDGSVEFRDHGGIGEINFFGLDLWRQRFREPEPERHPPWFTGVIQEALFPAHIAPYGAAPMMAGFGARFGGLADGRRKNRHKSAKLAFLSATETLRFRLANAWYKKRLHNELADLGGQLTEVWRDGKLTLAERKRRIFERWEECEDPTTARRTELDAMRLEVARTARAKIEAFVRQVAPLSSPQAYTEQELARLNAGRAGKTRFRPYDAPVLREDVIAESELGTTPGNLAPALDAPPRDPPLPVGRPTGPEAAPSIVPPAPPAKKTPTNQTPALGIGWIPPPRQ